MMFLSLFQDVPAETTGYMIAGYVVIFGVMLVYLLSLLQRGRSLREDLEVLNDVHQGKPE
jgi:hypothetical protein